MTSDNLSVSIDAASQSLGRVASRVAAELRGKTRPSFERHKLSGVRVVVKNVSRVRITGKKRTDKLYRRYSGYPGGLKFESFDSLIRRRGLGEVLRLAIKRMLPANKLRARMLKNLTIED